MGRDSNPIYGSLTIHLVNLLGNGDAGMANTERKQVFEEELEDGRMVMELRRNQSESKSLEKSSRAAVM